MTKVTTPIYTVGGKTRMAGRIIEEFPEVGTYSLYCEPFGGSAAVMLATDHGDQGVREVWNDLDANLLNFVDQVRQDPDTLYAQTYLTLWSREQTRRWRAEVLDPEGSGWWDLHPMERAVRWWALNRQCFSGWISSENAGWSHRTTGEGNWHPLTYRNAAARFVPFAERLSLVTTESLPWEDVVRKYGKVGHLVYADPPYLGTRHYEERANKYYSRPWTQEDDLALAAALRATPAMVVFSNYDRPELGAMFPGWRKVLLEGQHVSSANPEHHGTVRADEVLLMNHLPDGTRLGLGGGV